MDATGKSPENGSLIHAFTCVLNGIPAAKSKNETLVTSVRRFKSSAISGRNCDYPLTAPFVLLVKRLVNREDGSEVAMDREHVLSILRTNAPELKAAGVEHLRVFGSVARGEAGVNSDVDLLADFNPNFPLTLVTLGRTQIRLQEMLGSKVDLSNEAWLRPTVHKRAIKECIGAF